jgi:HAD superfamily hydrolase (TIGR01509 family)
MATTGRELVCFDLGGVLARIRRRWQECASAAGVRTGLNPDERYELSDFPLFDALQLGAIGENEYLSDLAAYLEVDEKAAHRVHNAILDRPYEGTEDLVAELLAAGSATACLSNTNSLHWEILDSDAFPAIRDLQFKMVSHTIKLLKPEIAVFRRFDMETGTAPEHVMYFDDHEGNVQAARKHGWNAFLVDHEGDPAAQMREALKGAGVL